MLQSAWMILRKGGCLETINELEPFCSSVVDYLVVSFEEIGVSL